MATPSALCIASVSWEWYAGIGSKKTSRSFGGRSYPWRRKQYASRPHRRMFDARTIRLLPEGTLLDPYKIYEVWYDGTGSKVIGIGFAGLDAEELLQHRMDPIRLFLWDEMAAIDAEAAHVVGMVAP